MTNLCTTDAYVVDDARKWTFSLLKRGSPKDNKGEMRFTRF